MVFIILCPCAISPRTFIQSTSNFGTTTLCIDIYWYDFFKEFPVVLLDFLNHYVWIDVGSMMYMASEVPFIGFFTVAQYLRNIVCWHGQ